MHKGFVLAMQVAHKVLGAFGQIENGLQVNNLGKDRLLIGELP